MHRSLAASGHPLATPNCRKQNQHPWPAVRPGPLCKASCLHSFSSRAAQRHCSAAHNDSQQPTQVAEAGDAFSALKPPGKRAPAVVFQGRQAPAAATAVQSPETSSSSRSSSAVQVAGSGGRREADTSDNTPSTSGSSSRSPAAHHNPVRTTGLRRTPLSGGVKNATIRYDLPPPAVAVRNLVEQAQFAHLCTVMSNMHHRRAGYPFGTLVDLASDGAGFPIFCLSPLAIHTRNIMEDPRCSLVVQMPGWSGLANARVTIFGDVYQLPQSMQAGAREIFLQKHSTDKKERWVSGNLLFFRMHRISDIYFVGGFGTVQWIDVKEYTEVKPDTIVLNEPHKTLEVLNEKFGIALRKVLAQPKSSEADDAAFISIDQLGADVRVRSGPDYSVERIGFDKPVQNLSEAMDCIRRLLNEDALTGKAGS